MTTLNEQPEPIKMDDREPIAHELTRKLVQYLIRGGQLKPGSRLPSERQLVSDLGVGRSTVREALKSLSFLGLVETRHGAGTYVTEPSGSLLPQVIEWGLLLGEPTVVELVKARQYIEIGTAELAAENRSDASLELLEAALAKMKTSRSDTDAFVASDVEFHLLLAEAAGNRFLSEILSSVQELLRVWIRRVIDAADSVEPTCREHEAILDAVRSGNPELARLAMTQHMDRASGRLFATLETENVSLSQSLETEDVTISQSGAETIQ